jgi:hypothetical protein
MWCASCMQLANSPIGHESCKHDVWITLSEEYTRNRELFKKQYNFEPKGETVELRPPPVRSVSR